MDIWLEYYNEERAHTGKYCNGRSPMQTWKEELYLVKEKLLEQKYQNVIFADNPDGKLTKALLSDQIETISHKIIN